MARDEIIKYTADVVCVRGNEVLTIRRKWDPFEGRLALPGGHVDKGETSLKAAPRELMEETGVYVDPRSMIMLGVYDQPDRDPRGRYVSVAYLAVVSQLAQAKPGDDAAEVVWMPWGDLLMGGLAFDHDRIVRDAWQRMR